MYWDSLLGVLEGGWNQGNITPIVSGRCFGEFKCREKKGGEIGKLRWEKILEFNGRFRAWVNCLDFSTEISLTFSIK